MWHLQPRSWAVTSRQRERARARVYRVGVKGWGVANEDIGQRGLYSQGHLM